MNTIMIIVALVVICGVGFAAIKLNKKKPSATSNGGSGTGKKTKLSTN